MMPNPFGGDSGPLTPSGRAAALAGTATKTCAGTASDAKPNASTEAWCGAAGGGVRKRKRITPILLTTANASTQGDKLDKQHAGYVDRI